MSGISLVMCVNNDITNINLSNNQLSGQIPKEIGNLIQLTYLGLYNNQLSGQIPKEIGNLIQLTYLGLSNNQLSGQIPKEIGNLIQLTDLGLYNNQLSGQIPKEIGNLIQLTYLDLFNNQLSGQIPQKFMQVCRQNQIPGCFPPRICTAFKNRTSSIDLQKCVSCVYSPLTIVILLLITGILMILAMRKFIKII